MLLGYMLCQVYATLRRFEVKKSMHGVAHVRARYSNLVKLLGEPDFVREGSYSSPTEKDLEHCYDSKVSVMWGYDYEGKKKLETNIKNGDFQSVIGKKKKLLKIFTCGL